MLCPNEPKPRVEIEEATMTLPITDTFESEPTLACPGVEISDPR